MLQTQQPDTIAQRALSLTERERELDVRERAWLRGIDKLKRLRDCAKPIAAHDRWSGSRPYSEPSNVMQTFDSDSPKKSRHSSRT